ncbi:MAG: hypothetical protein RI554_09150 [Trueperaceae bacterium]|nr:hypothetical protein [Trueperaceae bacterium]
MPPRYVLYVRGVPRLERDGRPVRLRHRKGLAALAVLAWEAAPWDRGRLADLLWDDRTEARARGNLRVVLADVAKRAPDLLVRERRTVAIAADTLSIAVREALDQQRRGPPRPLPDALHADVLNGFSVPDAAGFDAWASATAAAWRSSRLEAIDAALARLEAGEAPEVGDAADVRTTLLHQASTADPWNEVRAQAYVTHLASVGRRAEATAFADAFAALLETELGVTASLTVRADPRAVSAPPPPRPAWLDVPAVAPPLVGRDADVTAGVAALEAGTRVLTLHGLPGVGTSRVARAILAAWRRAAPSVPAARWRRVDAVATPTDLVPAPPGPALVFLDDVVDPHAVRDAVANAVAAAPDLRVVVAAHAPLACPGERTLPLRPLPTERDGDAPTSVGADAAPATHLLRRALEASVIGTSGPGGSPDALHRVAVWTHGHPLSLVLAAHALVGGGHTAATLVEGTAVERLREGPPDLPERHRSLARALAPTFVVADRPDAPASDHAALLTALASGASPLQVHVAVQVLEAAGVPQARAEAALRTAVTRGQVHLDARSGGTTLVLDATVADAVRGGAAPDVGAPLRAALRDARRAWALALARRAVDRSQAPYAARLLREVGDAMEDVESALDALVERDPEAGLDAAIELAALHRRFGPHAAAHARLVRLEARVGHALDVDAMGDLWNARGSLAFLADRRADARHDLERALEVRRASSDAEREAATRMSLAALEALVGDHEAALAQVRAVPRRRVSRWTRAALDVNLGNAHLAAGAPQAACAPYEASARALQELGDFEGAAGAALGWAAVAAMGADAAGVAAAYQLVERLFASMDQGADPRLAGALRIAVLRCRDAGFVDYAGDLSRLGQAAAERYGWRDAFRTDGG